MSIKTPTGVRTAVSKHQPEYRQHRFLSGWHFKLLAGGLLTLLSCNYTYLVVQPLGEQDDNGMVQYHLVQKNNHDILIMKLHPGLQENHIIKLTRKQRKEAQQSE